VIGTLRPSNPTQNAVIGSLRPTKSNQNSTIGTLRPSNPNQNSMIGTMRGGDMIGTLFNFNPSSEGGDYLGSIPTVDPLFQQTQDAVKQIEPKMPQIQQQAQEAARQIEPMMPQIRQQAQEAARQIQNDPAVQQLVQDNPQLNEPIIIMPRSVRAGNTGSGSSSGRRGQHRYGAGYSGGNGQGPLIYNP
jgi:hypothetical protein